MTGYTLPPMKLQSGLASGAFAEIRKSADNRSHGLSVQDPSIGEEYDLYIEGDAHHPVIRYSYLNDDTRATDWFELYNNKTNKTKVVTDNKQEIIDLVHPIGTYIETTTNTNPSKKLGGEWKLIDKQMKAQYLDSGIFTANSSACSVSSQAASIYGHNISFRIAVKYTGSDTTDTDTVMGYVKFSAIGLSRFPNSRYYNNGYNEQTNGSIAYSVGWEDGEIRYRYGEIATDNIIYFDFIVVITNIEHITDSFCDRFIWKRTA